MDVVDRVDAVRRIFRHISDDVDALTVRAELGRAVCTPVPERVVARREGDDAVAQALGDERVLERDDDLADDEALLRVEARVDVFVLREVLPVEVDAVATDRLEELYQHGHDVVDLAVADRPSSSHKRNCGTPPWSAETHQATSITSPAL